jgi:hypothetical protein
MFKTAVSDIRRGLCELTLSHISKLSRFISLIASDSLSFAAASS